MAIERSLYALFVFLVFLTGSSSKVGGASHHHHHHRHHVHHHHRNGFPEKLFVFGDSYADTGNFNKSYGGPWMFPYGITYPGKPTGRFSDGRVLTDFFAESLGLPTPIPYSWRNLNPEKQVYGINFAYGATGVFDTSTYLPNMTTQIGEFESLINDGLYSHQDLQSSLALVSVTGNDYSVYQNNSGTIQGLLAFIEALISQLSVDLQRLSILGVRKIVVTAIEPLGCLPRITAASSYLECNETFNNVSIVHNQLLQEAANKMNSQTNASTVVLLDLYDIFWLILSGQDPQGKKKFEEPLKPCCAGTSADADCGTVVDGVKMYTLCESPTSSFFWDRVHPTQAGWSSVIASLQGTLQSLTL